MVFTFYTTPEHRKTHFQNYWVHSCPGMLLVIPGVQYPYPISDQNMWFSLPVFRPKRLKNHTLWRRTYVYSLYKGVPPLPPPGSWFGSQNFVNENILVILILTKIHNKPAAAGNSSKFPQIVSGLNYINFWKHSYSFGYYENIAYFYKQVNLV